MSTALFCYSFQGFEIFQMAFGWKGFIASELFSFGGKKKRLKELCCAGRGEQLRVIEVRGHLGLRHEFRIQEMHF